MKKTILITAAALGMSGIILGAFGAHGLEKLLDADQLQTFEVGVRYQMYHALFLLFVGLYSFASVNREKLVYWLACIGVLFFSGSIYGLATNAHTGFDFKTIALITPVGGFMLIVAWMLLFVEFIFKKSNK
ncbi:MAG: DUF423 domain-containing protein [Flavobacteriaceae bacterium]|nr:DUF423 domain-containing protein [Flavobacteriaceae bacterium]